MPGILVYCSPLVKGGPKRPEGLGTGDGVLGLNARPGPGWQPSCRRTSRRRSGWRLLLERWASGSSLRLSPAACVQGISPATCCHQDLVDVLVGFLEVLGLFLEPIYDVLVQPEGGILPVGLVVHPDFSLGPVDVPFGDVRKVYLVVGHGLQCLELSPLFLSQFDHCLPRRFFSRVWWPLRQQVFRFSSVSGVPLGEFPFLIREPILWGPLWDVFPCLPALSLEPPCCRWCTPPCWSSIFSSGVGCVWSIGCFPLLASTRWWY